jgi:diguanylate cyclase (GGDEF)-like protein
MERAPYSGLPWPRRHQGANYPADCVDNQGMGLVSGQVRPRLSPSRQDVWLGAGLVSTLAVMMSCTSWAIHVPPGALTQTFAILAIAMGINVLLFLQPWGRLRSRLPLMVFPVLLLVTLLAIAAVDQQLAASYTGVLTLTFIYIGLTQRPGTPTLFTFLAAPVWIVCQENQSTAVGVRIPMVLIVWIVIGEVMAAHTSASRTRTDELVAQASNDALTGLAGRQSMTERIDYAIAEADDRPSSLLVLDLDGFKAINDAYGHAVGDELLIIVAERIRAHLSASDLLVRLGGDEFAAYLNECDPPSAIGVGQRLVEAVAGPIELSRGNVTVTASVGIIDLHECGSSQDAMGGADVAMYEAKLKGKNRVAVFESNMRDRIASRFQLGAELRTAFEDSQFETFYQPTVETRTGEVTGYEALLRWHHPQRGLLAAGSFIEVCEESGLIMPLGTWILNAACRQIQQWRVEDPGHPISIAVNLASRQLLDVELVADVKAALRDSGLPGQALVLEITERVLLVDSRFVLHQLSELKALGVRIAVDDFGTGYSSLAYLRKFPIDILKIDRSFVEVLDDDRQAVALAKSIVGIAEALELEVIAEGAETASQVAALSDMGCHVIQGFYFGHPMSADELGSIADRHRIGPSRTLHDHTQLT